MASDNDLALAAKAAGKRRGEWDYDWLRDCGHEISRDMLWDPRRDSGQALELAALLDLTVERYDGNSTIAGNVLLEHWPHEPDGDDRNAGMRRAIYRAAVAIGKAMP